MMYKSPASVPFSPASPSPATLRFVPSSAPAGILISSFLVFLTTPVPSQAAHSFFMYFPWPWHFPQVVVVEKIPNGVLCVLLCIPLPLQLGQFTMSDSDSAPEPWHFAHCSSLGTTTCFTVPVNASSKSISISYLKSAPLLRVLFLEPKGLPPKKLSKMLSKSKLFPVSDIKSLKSNPSNPFPPNCSAVVPYWSYWVLFWSSARTAAASFISLNFSVASELLFKSG